jgi:hypothetical protein
MAANLTIERITDAMPSPDQVERLLVPSEQSV